MKYFNRPAFISNSNIYCSISTVTGMNEFLMLYLPTVELIQCCQAFTKFNKLFAPSLKLCFCLFNFASFFLFSKVLLQLFLLTKQTIAFLGFNITSGLLNLSEASMPHFSIFTFISDIMEITATSKLLSSTESNITLIMLFLLPY